MKLIAIRGCFFYQLLQDLGYLVKAMKEEPHYQKAREQLLEHLRQAGITDPLVLEAMNKIPRQIFLKGFLKARAYEDRPVVIDCGQTISQPYIVAQMTSLLCRGERLGRVLEIGTGSGYQAAILSQLVDRVYSVERIRTLSMEALQHLQALKIQNVELRVADGYLGWPEKAPFQGIIVTAAPVKIPPLLLEQLEVGGRLVIPVGADGWQQLKVIDRLENGFQETIIEAVRFVPLLPGVQ